MYMHVHVHILYMSYTYLEVHTLGTTELLQVKVEHGSYAVGHFRSQKRFSDVFGEIMEGGESLIGQSEVGATLTLVL